MKKALLALIVIAGIGCSDSPMLDVTFEIAGEAEKVSATIDYFPEDAPPEHFTITEFPWQYSTKVAEETFVEICAEMITGDSITVNIYVENKLLHQASIKETGKDICLRIDDLTKL